MHARFTDRAESALQLANTEAERLGDEYISTEHILRGLVKEGGGVAAGVLKQLGVQLKAIAVSLEKFEKIEQPASGFIGNLPQTPRAKKAMEYAIDEAGKLGDDRVGTEHILLGLLHDDDGISAQVLMNLGLRREQVRAAILAIPRRSDDEDNK